MSSAAPAPPAARSARRRLADLPPGLPILALGLLMLGALALALRYAWQTNIYLADEFINVLNGRQVGRDLGALTDSGVFDRGPERLTALTVAAAEWLMPTTPGAMRAGHAAMAAGWVSAAVPVYLLARGLRVERWAAVLAAFAAVTGPWLLFGTTFLNVTYGFPLTMLFAYVLWRGAVRPSPVGDALIVAVAIVNVLARTAHAPFALVAVPVVLYATWLRMDGPTGLGARLAAYPRRLLAEHWLLAAVGALGAVAVGVLGLDRLAGSAYSAGFTIRPEIVEYAATWFAQLTIATGYLPVLVGVPWLLREAVRPRATDSGVFAVIALGLFAMFVVVTSGSGTTFEERYVAVLAGLPLVALVAVIGRRQATVVGTLLVGALAGRAIATAGQYADPSPFSWFVAPARLEFSQVVLGRTKTMLEVPDAGATTVATVLIVLAAAIVAALFSPRVAGRLPSAARSRTALAGYVVLAGLAVLGVASGRYTMSKYEPVTLPDKTFEQMAWIDAATSGRQAAVWNYGGSIGGGRQYLTELLLYHNSSACCSFLLTDLRGSLDSRGGLPWFGAPPAYLAQFSGYHPLALESREVERSTLLGDGPLGMRLSRVSAPLRAAVRFDGPADDGTVPRGERVTIAVLPDGRRPGRCLRLGLAATEGPVRYEMQVGDERRAGTLRASTPRTVQIPIGGARRGTLSGVPQGRGGLQLGESAVVRC